MNNLKIIATRLSLPSDPGFPDKCAIEDLSTGSIIWSTLNWGTYPNPGGKWAILAQGTLNFKCIDHTRFGKCLILNGGGKCNSVILNPNKKSRYYGEPFLDEAFCHCGFRSDGELGEDTGWRGSAGCQTCNPDEWFLFIKHFKFGDVGEYVLIDESNINGRKVV